MRFIKLYTSTTNWEINIDGDDKDIIKYFMNNYFNVESYPNERKDKVHTIAFLNEGKTFNVLAIRNIQNIKDSSLIGKYDNLKEAETFIKNHLKLDCIFHNNLILGYIIKTT